MKRPVAPLLLVVLTGTFLLFFAIAAFVGGSLYVAGAFLLALPVTAALATFRCSVTPLAVALALSVPLALLTVFFATSVPNVGTGVAWSAFLAVVFVVVLLSGYFASYRRRTLEAKRVDA